MDEKYAEMTVNERLYLSGKMQEFDSAVEKKDVEKVKFILKNLEVDDASIEAILKSM